MLIYRTTFVFRYNKHSKELLSISKHIEHMVPVSLKFLYTNQHSMGDVANITLAFSSLNISWYSGLVYLESRSSLKNAYLDRNSNICICLFLFCLIFPNGKYALNLHHAFLSIAASCSLLDEIPILLLISASNSLLCVFQGVSIS